MKAFDNSNVVKGLNDIIPNDAFAPSIAFVTNVSGNTVQFIDNTTYNSGDSIGEVMCRVHDKITGKDWTAKLTLHASTGVTIDVTGINWNNISLSDTVISTLGRKANCSMPDVFPGAGSGNLIYINDEGVRATDLG